MKYSVLVALFGTSTCIKLGYEPGNNSCKPIQWSPGYYCPPNPAPQAPPALVQISKNAAASMEAKLKGLPDSDVTKLVNDAIN